MGEEFSREQRDVNFDLISQREKPQLNDICLYIYIYTHKKIYPIYKMYMIYFMAIYIYKYIKYINNYIK